MTNMTKAETIYLVSGTVLFVVCILHAAFGMIVYEKIFQ